MGWFPGLLYKGSPWTPDGYVIWADSGGGLWLERNGDFVSSGPGSLTSAFRYFVITYDGTNVRWYVDGALVTTQAEAFPPNAGNSVFQLGKGDFYGNNGLDEVALYGTALSAARVAAHFAAGT